MEGTFQKILQALMKPCISLAIMGKCQLQFKKKIQKNQIFIILALLDCAEAGPISAAERLDYTAPESRRSGVCVQFDPPGIRTFPHR